MGYLSAKDIFSKLPHIFFHTKKPHNAYPWLFSVIEWFWWCTLNFLGHINISCISIYLGSPFDLFYTLHYANREVLSVALLYCLLSNLVKSLTTYLAGWVVSPLCSQSNKIVITFKRGHSGYKGWGLYFTERVWCMWLHVASVIWLHSQVWVFIPLQCPVIYNFVTSANSML